VDSDLAEAVDALKDSFKRRKLDYTLGKAAAPLVDELKKTFRIPPRYRHFLLEANPVRVETATPVEKVRLIPAEELAQAQASAKAGEGGAATDWRGSWVVVGESALLGDPYFLDVSKPDPEGDCPVYTAMSGQEKWVPTLAASSFAQFLRILATGMEIASGFGEAIMDDEDEENFREAMAPKVKVIDGAALRAGHWT
jgi:hypothetical protein